jgi:hypothetical protein
MTRELTEKSFNAYAVIFCIVESGVVHSNLSLDRISVEIESRIEWLAA